MIMQIFTYICLKGCHKIEVDEPHRCNEYFNPLSFIEYPVYYLYALELSFEWMSELYYIF